MTRVFIMFFMLSLITCSDSDNQLGKSLSQEIAIIEMHNAGVNELFINKFSSILLGTEYFTIIAPTSSESEPSFDVKQYIIREKHPDDFLIKSNQIKAMAGNMLTISIKNEIYYINDIAFKTKDIIKIGTAYIILIDAFFE